MKIKATNYNLENIDKNKMYFLKENQDIIFLETHEDEVVEKVVFNITNFDDGEIYFCKEYRPACIYKEGHKAADILVIKLQEVAFVYIYDVKRNFYCDDEIEHFVEQINSTYYDSQGLLKILRYEDSDVTWDFGVVTSSFDEEKIQEQLDFYKNAIENNIEKTNNLGIRKNYRKPIDAEKKSFILEHILNKKIILQDKTIHDLNIFIMNKNDNMYEAELVI